MSCKRNSSQAMIPKSAAVQSDPLQSPSPSANQRNSPQPKKYPLKTSLTQAEKKLVAQLKRPKPHEVDMVIYHRACTDGFGAAWAAWKVLGDQAKYISCAHGGSLPYGLEGKNVVIADFSFSLAETIEIIQKVKSFLILDHHVTAKEVLAVLPDEIAVFDIDHSGARLAWDYFHPGVAPPKLIDYIEDRDLWRFHLPQSRQFYAALEQVPFKFPAYDALTDTENLKKHFEKGEVLFEYVNHMVERLVRRSTLRELAGFKARVLNSPVWISELGNALTLLPDCQVAVIWQYSHSRNAYSVSLRSASDDVNVSLIAQKFGGGGHVRAAGLSWRRPIEEFFD